MNKQEMVFVKQRGSKGDILHIGSYWGPYIPKEFNVERVWQPLWCDGNRAFRPGDQVWTPEERPGGYRVCKRCLRNGLGRMWRPISTRKITAQFENKLRMHGLTLEECREDGNKLVLMVKFRTRDIPVIAWCARETLMAVFQVNGKAYNEEIILYDFEKLRWRYTAEDGVDRDPGQPDVDRLYDHVTDHLVKKIIGKDMPLVGVTKQWQEEGEEGLFSG